MGLGCHEMKIVKKIAILHTLRITLIQTEHTHTQIHSMLEQTDDRPTVVAGNERCELENSN